MTWINVPIIKFLSLNTDKSTRVFFLTIWDMKKQIPEKQETPKIQRIQVALNQSALFPLSKNTCKHNNQIVKNKNPNPSILTPFWRCEYGGLNNIFLERIAAKQPKGTLIKKIHGQDQLSVIQPPKTGPTIGAIITPIPNTAIAVPRFSLGKLSIISACEIGTIPPPPAPCNTLNITISPKFLAIPQSIDAIVNIIILIM